MKISLVYLGRRGGGALLTKSLALVGQKYSLVNEVLYSKANLAVQEDIGIFHKTAIKVPHQFLEIFIIPFTLPIHFWQSLRWAFRTRGDLVLFVMASPFDLISLLAIRLFNKQIAFIIHESTPHAGERWPSVNAIRLRIYFSRLVVSFSSSESDKIKKVRDKKYVYVPHPIGFIQGSKGASLGMNTLPRPRVLFIGRIRDYKGLDVLFQAWENISEGTLIIAGEGTLPKKQSGENCLIINRWLSDSEILEAIDASEVVVFPYSSASQSGTLPICIARGKKVVISDLPGLVEQTKLRPDLSTIVTPGDWSSLQRGLLSTFSRPSAQLISIKYYEDMQIASSLNVLSAILKSHLN